MFRKKEPASTIKKIVEIIKRNNGLGNAVDLDEERRLECGTHFIPRLNFLGTKPDIYIYYRPLIQTMNVYGVYKVFERGKINYDIIEEFYLDKYDFQMLLLRYI